MIELNERLATEIINASESIYLLSKKIKFRKIEEGEITELKSKEAIQYAVSYDRFNCPQKYYHFQYLKWIVEIRKNHKTEKYITTAKNFEIKNLWIKQEIEKISKIQDKTFGGVKEYKCETEELGQATKIFELMIEQIIGQNWRKNKPLLWD